MKSNVKLKELDLDTSIFLYQTDKNWTFSLEDGKSRQFGISYEILDMKDATGEPEFKDYKYVVSASIMAHKVHKSFDESGNDKPDLFSLRWDCERYMGGIPIDHILQSVTRGDESNEDGFKNIVDQFTPFEAKIVTNEAQFGTYAAQNGRGAEHSYLQFKTIEAAKKYIQILATRAPIMQALIGQTLDRPINMMGDDGWSVITKQVKGCR